MSTNQSRRFSVLTSDIERNPHLLDSLQLEAYAHGENVTVTTSGLVTTVTAA